MNSIDSAGDVDFDGVADVIIGDPYYFAAPNVWGEVVVRSGADCSKILHQFYGTGVVSTQFYGYSVAGVGDVDGDGHADFLIGFPGQSVTSPGAGACSLHSGKDGSLLWSAVGGPGLHGFVGDSLGHTVAGVGDANLDGFPDWAVSSFLEPVNPPQLGVVRIHTGLTNTQPVVLTDGAQKGFGYSVAGVEDANGDGRSDVVVGSIGFAGRVTLFSGADGSIVWAVPGSDSMGEFGFAVDGAGDVDGDGLGDVIAGSSSVASGGGRASVFSGSSGGLLLDVLGAPPAGIGHDVAGVGDVNGDGRADVAVCTTIDQGFRVYSVLEKKILTVVPGPLARVARGGDHDLDGTLDILAMVPPAEVRVYSGSCDALVRFGSGCPGSGGLVPSLDADLLACVLKPGDAFTLTIEGGLGGETALLVFGAAKASIPTGACTLLVAPLVGPLLPIPLGGSGPGKGNAILPVTVPPAAAGATFRLQALATDPNAPFGYTATNGLSIQVD